MKKALFYVCLLTILFASCAPREDHIIYDTIMIPSPTPETLKPTTVDPADLAIIKKFAESYEPKSGREVIPSPPLPSEKVAKIIADLANGKSREHEKFIILIFLRLSRFQIEHFRQRYELGRDNPLTREFYRLIGETNYKHAEIMPAYLADNYVEEHPELLEYRLIDTEMKRIEKAGQKIQRDLDNTTKKQASEINTHGRR